MSDSHKIITDVAYNELVALITASELEPGLYYRITDFQTKHYMLDGGEDVIMDGATPITNTGAVEPLTVLALDVNILSHEAKSELYPNDVIHYDWNPDNWIYDIAFAGFDEEVLTGWKGVIYWRHYTLNDISAPGDWRNVKCRRWALDDTPSGFDTAYAGISSYADGVSDPDDYADYRMFEETETDPLDERVSGLKIKLFRDKNNLLYGIIPTILPNIVFHVKADGGQWQILNIEMGGISFNNTFAGYTENNTIGNYFHSNTIGDRFYSNTIGDRFYSNTIASNFNSNPIIGDNFYSNTIGDNFHNNNIGSKFYSNTIGNSFYSNTIGNNFFHNTIDGPFYYNIIGTRFYINTIGPSFNYNTIGNSFYSNTIGNYFHSNTIGNYFNNNTIGNYFYSNVAENVVEYLETPDKTSENTSFHNNVIRSGVYGTSVSYLDFTIASHVFAGYNCEIFIASDTNVKLSYIKEDNGTYSLEIVDYDA